MLKIMKKLETPSPLARGICGHWHNKEDPSNIRTEAIHIARCSST